MSSLLIPSGVQRSTASWLKGPSLSPLNNQSDLQSPAGEAPACDLAEETPAACGVCTPGLMYHKSRIQAAVNAKDDDVRVKFDPRLSKGMCKVHVDVAYHDLPLLLHLFDV